MPDRLDELKRQRALAQQQVEWFDREIAREGGQLATPATPQPAPAAPAPIVAPATATAPAISVQLSEEDAARAAAEVFARYRPAPSQTPADVKKGCILYFVFAMGLMAIFAVSAYFLYVSTRDNSEGDPPAAVAP